ncbi:hypothetical protein J4E08_23445, partial [Sagittula sp. NFXS13]
MIRRIQQGLIAEGAVVSVAKLCAWFGIPRRTVYYKPVKAAPKVEARFCEPIKKLIEEEPSFGYRTVAWLLGFNKNTVQRIFQIKGWPLLSYGFTSSRCMMGATTQIAQIGVVAGDGSYPSWSSGIVAE